MSIATVVHSLYFCTRHKVLHPLHTFSGILLKFSCKLLHVAMHMTTYVWLHNYVITYC